MRKAIFLALLMGILMTLGCVGSSTLKHDWMDSATITSGKQSKLKVWATNNAKSEKEFVVKFVPENKDYLTFRYGDDEIEELSLGKVKAKETTAKKIVYIHGVSPVSKSYVKFDMELYWDGKKITAKTISVEIIK